MTHLATTYRRVLLLVGVAAAALPICAYAQTAPAKPPASPADVSEVVITGSRIRRSSADENQPLQVVGAEAAVERGLLNIADVINDLPQIGVPESQRGAQGANVGRNYINLFGLGSQRTLTLVDGQRFVSSNPGSSSTRNPGSQVDLNNIPVLLVDRVEVIQATGAATYGSDAIAGVANIILKKNFEGAMADAQAGVSDRGDYANYAARGLVGRSFADGRGNIEVSFEHAQNDPLYARDRASSASLTVFGTNPANVNRTDGRPANIAVPDWRVPELSPNGVPFVANSPLVASILTMPDPNRPGSRVRAQFGPGGNLIPYDIGTPYAIALASGGDGANLGDLVSLYAPLKRDLVYALGNYELTDHIRLSTSLMASRVKARNLGAQGPFLNGTILSGTSAAIQIQSTNAFLTPQAQGILQSQGITRFFLARTNSDIYNGQVDNASQTQRGVVTLDGDFKLADREFYWNANFNYGHSGGRDTSQTIVQQRFLNAADAVLSPSGEVVCRTTLQNPASTDPAISGCKPLNLFGYGAPSQDAINYILTELESEYDLYETDIQANVGGDVIKLPAGMVKFSAGFEHRKEKSSFEPNDAARLGLGRDPAIAAVHARYSTDEAYGELSIPLIGGDFTLPLVKALTIDMAGRLVDNSQTGRDHAWNVGSRWSVVDGMTVRGSISRTFRAPSIVELFQPRASLIASLGNDPCDRRFIGTGPNPSARGRNCQALFTSLGLPANFQLTSIAVSIPPPQTLGGNPNLKNETADSWTAGVLFEPRFAPGLSLSIDYVSVSLKQAISTFNSSSILSTCFDSPSPDPDVCGLVTRDANAQVTSVTTGYVNAGYTNFRAVSYAASYTRPMFDNQQLTLSLDVLNTQDLESSVSGLGFDLVQSAGALSTPRWKGQAKISYMIDRLTLNWATNYVGRVRFNNTATIEDQFPLRLDSYFRSDLSAQYRLKDAVTLRAGVNNIFDQLPNSLATGQTSSSGAGYDVIGRAYYAGVRLKF
ncbi:MAG: TonB-dependent receptor domain-containing protein [Phenylobacterium sp.]